MPLFWPLLGSRYHHSFYCISKCTTFDIKPVYHFEDIGVLDLRVCYNGEWFVTEPVSDNAISKIIDSQDVSPAIKQEISRLIALKGMISFYDIYHVAYPEVSTQLPGTLAAQN